MGTIKETESRGKVNFVHESANLQTRVLKIFLYKKKITPTDGIFSYDYIY
jgi:hypothetical protein